MVAYRCFICNEECLYEDPASIYLKRRVKGIARNVETLVCEYCKRDYLNFVEERDENFIKNKLEMLLLKKDSIDISY